MIFPKLGRKREERNPWPEILVPSTISGFSLRTEVAGGYYRVTEVSGHSEKNLPSRLLQAIEI